MIDTDRITRLEPVVANLGGMALSQQREITRLKPELHRARIDASLD
jgi:hypothetical protein